MPHVALIVPGDVETRTGGYIYDKRMAEGLRAHGWTVDIRQPDLAALGDGTIALVDGLALLALGDTVARHARRLRIVLLIHLPLSLEVGLGPAEAARRDALERRAMPCARMAIATGRSTADLLAARGARVALVEPGTDPAPVARGSIGDGVALVSVAALTIGKGHEALLTALAAVPSRGWSLTCAGSVDRDPATAARTRSTAETLGLGGRVTFAGELDDRRLAALYDRSDAFVCASLRETYGMAIAEAIARALPVVTTDVGAARQIVGAGGIVVRPDAPSEFVDALTRVITDPDLRARLRDGAGTARERLTTWEQASRTMADALAAVETDG